MNRRNFIIYDLETSGLDFKGGAEIVQISAITANANDYNKCKSIPAFNILIKPQTPDLAEKKAISVIGDKLWSSAQADGLHPKTALRKFKEYMELSNPSGSYMTTPILVGFNICNFDNPFLEHHLEKHKILTGKNSLPWSNVKIDLMPLMFSVFGRDNLKNNRLDTYAELLGLRRNSDTHDAEEDTEITYEIFKRYMNFMNFKIRPKITIRKEYERV